MAVKSPGTDSSPSYRPTTYPSDTEPILYSGEIGEDGGGTGGNTKGPNASDPPPTGTSSGAAVPTGRLESQPLLSVPGALRTYVAGEPFHRRMTLDDFTNSPEVRTAARQAAMRNERAPDAFVFFNEPRTEMKLLLSTDRGPAMVHQRLDHGTFEASSQLAPGAVVPAQGLAQLLGASAPHTPPRSRQQPTALDAWDPPAGQPH